MIPESEYALITRRMPIPCVDLIVQDPGGRILLIKRKNEPAKGEWWFPGGRIWLGEMREDTVDRKLMEECGLTPSQKNEIGTYDLILPLSEKGQIRHGISTLFLVKVPDKSEVRLDNQSSAWQWKSIRNWLKMDLHNFVRKVFREIQ